MGVVISHGQDIRPFSRYPGEKILPVFPQGLGPAVDEELQRPRHPVPVDGGGEDQEVLLERPVQQFPVIVLGIGSLLRVSVVDDRFDPVIGQENGIHVHSFDQHLRQSLGISASAGAGIQHGDLHGMAPFLSLREHPRTFRFVATSEVDLMSFSLYFAGFIVNIPLAMSRLNPHPCDVPIFCGIRGIDAGLLISQRLR